MPTEQSEGTTPPQTEVAKPVEIQPPIKIYPPKDKYDYGDVYKIFKTETGYEVIIYGFSDPEKEYLIGTSQIACSSLEEARAKAEKSKEYDRIFFEKSSLAKSFIRGLYSINQNNNEFSVITPELIYRANGRNYIGKSVQQTFTSWEEAKDYYLHQREKMEILRYDPMYEIPISETETISFSDFYTYNPETAPTDKPRPISATAEKYLLTKDKMQGTSLNAKTYQETIKEKDWEKKLFSFISSYLGENGADIIRQLDITRLDSLTPKQAIELSTQIVIDLTKYKYSDVGSESSTKADQSTTLHLLQEGLNHKNDPKWEGNGVCRNFTCMVKAVFESLKANQTKFNRLQNTYCLYEGGRAHAPKKKYTEKDSGHAWNTFVTVLNGGKNDLVILDSTWDKRNLETKKLEREEYIFTRMEPIINTIGNDIDNLSVDKQTQLKNILEFYGANISFPGPGNSSKKEMKEFYLDHAIRLISKHGFSDKIPYQLEKGIKENFFSIEADDPRTISFLYKFFLKYPELDFTRILKAYLENKELTDYHKNNIVFSNDQLQLMVYDQIKNHQNFEEFLKESPEFRVRMRELLPQILLDFSPTTNLEDVRELAYLIDISMLRNLYLSVDRYKLISTKELESLSKKIRQRLNGLNSQKYDQDFSRLDDYQLIKQFDEIYRKLST